MISCCYIIHYQLAIILHQNVLITIFILLEIGLDVESTIYLVNKKWYEDKRKRDAQRGYILFSEYIYIYIILLVF